MIKNYRMYSWTIFEVFSIGAVLQQIFGSRAFVPLENCIVFFMAIISISVTVKKANVSQWVYCP